MGGGEAVSSEAGWSVARQGTGRAWMRYLRQALRDHCVCVIRCLRPLLTIRVSCSCCDILAACMLEEASDVEHVGAVGVCPYGGVIVGSLAISTKLSSERSRATVKRLNRPRTVYKRPRGMIDGDTHDGSLGSKSVADPRFSTCISTPFAPKL